MNRLSIPYGKQQIDEQDIEAVVSVLRSPWITQGPAIEEFEAALAAYCGARFAVVTSSGTSALHMAYLAAGITDGDEVITTPNSFVATTNMLLAVGARPVFSDITLNDYNIDSETVEQQITSRTKAIVPVHFAGVSCGMKSIQSIANRHNLVVIEDACHALGGSYADKKIGSCEFSDMAVFSFHPVKSITTGEGGAVLTNNEQLFKRLRSLRTHGVHKNESGKNIMTELGYNYRMTDFQAVLGSSQLKKIDDFISSRRKVSKWYEENLKACSDVVTPGLKNVNDSSCHLYVIRVVDAERRDSLAEYLKTKGVAVNFHYPAIYSHPYYRENGFQSFSLTNEELYQSSCITLPCYVGLQEEQVAYICDLIKAYFVHA